MTQDETRAILVRLAATEADLAVKGTEMPYLAVNGNMSAFVDPEGALCLRFAEADRAALAAEIGTGPRMHYGAVKRGYVAIPDIVVTDPVRLAVLFARMPRPCAGIEAEADETLGRANGCRRPQSCGRETAWPRPRCAPLAPPGALAI